MFEIRFTYDEKTRLWAVSAHGATSAKEALEGFNAVILTCRGAHPGYNKAELKEPNGVYEISIGLI